MNYHLEKVNKEYSVCATSSVGIVLSIKEIWLLFTHARDRK